MVGSCYVSSVCYQVASCRLDKGADLGQHVRCLDKYMTDDIGKLLLKFFDLATRFLFNLLAVSETSCGGMTLDTHRTVHGPSRQERPSPQDYATRSMAQVGMPRKVT